MILALIEHDRGKLNDISLEMLALARRTADAMGAPLHALIAGTEARTLAERMGGHGVSVVHIAGHERLTDYAPGAWAQCIVELAGRLTPRMVMAAGTDRGNEVMAHTAARMKLPMAANCIEVRAGDPVGVTRLRWGGSLLEEAEIGGATVLLSVAPHVIPAQESSVAPAPQVETFTPGLSERDLREQVAGRVERAPGQVSLADARVVIGGGRGVGSAEGFKTLEGLAGAVGGVVGCSRAVTSNGWRPHSDQIGQTGTRISAEMYIACGVSGAIQHMVGCQGAKRILAVNTDPEAPIFLKADYGVIGDLHEVLPAVAEAIRKARG